MKTDKSNRIIYGLNAVTEALKSGSDIVKVCIAHGRNDESARELLELSNNLGVTIERPQRRELDNICMSSKHQGVCCELRGSFSYLEIEDLLEAWKLSGERAVFLILDSIEDPQNLGAMIRSAHAAGVTGIVLPKDRACHITSTVVKTSAGASAHVKIAMVTNLAQTIEKLKKENIWVYAIEADGEATIYSEDLTGNIAIVVGSEGAGVRRLVRDACDGCLKIPMKGKVSSLNAAQAGTLALFESLRQTELAGK